MKTKIVIAAVLLAGLTIGCVKPEGTDAALNTPEAQSTEAAETKETGVPEETETTAETAKPNETETTAETAEPDETDEVKYEFEQIVGPWHLADDTDLEKLSEVFPGANDKGSGMEIRSDGRISWYIGETGAAGTCILDGGTLWAYMTDSDTEEGFTARITILEQEKMTMTYKDTDLTWVFGDEGSKVGMND